jgi:hypothetical protein
VNQDIFSKYANSSLEDMKVYGSITNSGVNMRKNYKPPTVRKIANQNISAIKKAVAERAGAGLNEDMNQEKSTKPDAAKPPTEAKGKPKAPANTKSGALFSSFAKAKAKPPIPKPAPKVVEEEDSVYSLVRKHCHRR